MKKILLLLIVAACAAAPAAAQNEGTDYRTALGFKYYPAGITLKQFVSRHVALEAIGYIRQQGFRLTLLSAYHDHLGNVPGLNWYAGPGLHVGFRSDRWKASHPDGPRKTPFGVDGVLGVDYKLRGLPLNLSIDWQPSFTFSGENIFEAGWGGVAIRYAF